MENFLKHNSIEDFLLDLEAKFSERTSHSIKTQDGWKNYTYKQTIDSAFALMTTLQTSGLSRGDRAIIISRNRPEFCFTFFACSLLGVVAIPVDPRMNIKDLQFIYDHSEPSAIITLSADDHFLATEIAAKDQNINIIESSFIASTGIETYRSPAHTFSPADPALIIYTSGTTSRPKGVIITYNNLFSQVDGISSSFKLKDDLRFLSILPLNHLFEFTTGLILPFAKGGEVCYGNSLLPTVVIEALKQKEIREMMCVPLFLKMLKKGIESKMNEKKLLQKYFQFGLLLSRFIKNKTLRKIYFLPIHLSFGGNLRRFISGGSSLEANVEEFFGRLGFTIHQGYGLTETSPVATANTKAMAKNGSVGVAIKDVSVKLDAVTGEILIKGPNIMKGYFKDQALTDEVIDKEGWFHTGDVGTIDTKGFLTITGRIKELIVLPNGKKVAPQDVEDELMKNTDVIKEACIVGAKIAKGSMKGLEEVCAIIVPQDQHLNLKDSEIQGLLKETLMSISEYKRPTRIVIQRKELEKTSTLKTKRILIKTQLEIADQNQIASESTKKRLSAEASTKKAETVSSI